MARLLGAQVAAKEFSWGDWGHTGTAGTCGQAIAKLRRHYLSSGGSQGTWEGDYWKALKGLPQDAPLSPDRLTTLVATTAMRSR